MKYANQQDMLNNSRLQRPTLVVNYCLIAVIFALNFVGLPSVKFVHLAYFCFALICTALLDLRTTIHFIISFAFIEGQSRILWNYHPLARVAFDLLVSTTLLRCVVNQRGIRSVGTLPRAGLVLILLHFLWYLVQFFNPASVTILAPLAAIKIYVFPFFVFLMFRNQSEIFEETLLEGVQRAVFFLIVAECTLALYQLMQGDTFMLGISPYYRSAMRDGVFTGLDFRPFGTAFLPGAISVYLYLAIGLVFLVKRTSKLFWTSTVVLGVLAVITLLATQVRSATLKFGFVYLISVLAVSLVTKLSAFSRLGVLIKTAIVGALLVSLTGLVASTQLIDLGPGLARWDRISSYEEFKSGRAGPEMAWVITKLRLAEFPLGIGPGLTGAASSVSRDVIEKDPIYTKETFWGYDNFYLSLIVEFGYGAVFYMLLLLCIPVFIARTIVRLVRRDQLFEARVAIISLSQVVVIMLGNWGAIGLPYNPESFFFWFWTALALNMERTSLNNA